MNTSDPFVSYSLNSIVAIFLQLFLYGVAFTTLCQCQAALILNPGTRHFKNRDDILWGMVVISLALSLFASVNVVLLAKNAAIAVVEQDINLPFGSVRSEDLKQLDLIAPNSQFVPMLVSVNSSVGLNF
jgi:hypothetical protein